MVMRSSSCCVIVFVSPSSNIMIVSASSLVGGGAGRRARARGDGVPLPTRAATATATVRHVLVFHSSPHPYTSTHTHSLHTTPTSTKTTVATRSHTTHNHLPCSSARSAVKSTCSKCLRPKIAACTTTGRVPCCVRRCRHAHASMRVEAADHHQVCRRTRSDCRGADGWCSTATLCAVLSVKFHQSQWQHADMSTNGNALTGLRRAARDGAQHEPMALSTPLWALGGRRGRAANGCVPLVLLSFQFHLRIVIVILLLVEPIDETLEGGCA